MYVGAGTTPPHLYISPLKTDSAENAPAKTSVGVKIPRVSAQSEIFSGFRLSPRRRTWVFKLQYIGGRFFFYTTVAVSLLRETGQVRIRAESPAQGGKSGHFCQDRRKTDSGQSRGGGLLAGGAKSGRPCRNRPEKCSNLRAKLRGEINKPADFALGVGGYFSVESRADSRQKLTSPLILDAKNQAAAGKYSRSWDLANRPRTGTFPKLRSGGPCETPLKLEILSRTRSSAVGREFPAGPCNFGLILDAIVGRAARREPLGRRPKTGRLSAPNLTPNFVV